MVPAVGRRGRRSEPSAPHRTGPAAHRLSPSIVFAFAEGGDALGLVRQGQNRARRGCGAWPVGPLDPGLPRGTVRPCHNPRVLLTITLTKPPATYLGYLLHRSPDRLHLRELASGQALVFCPEATAAGGRRRRAQDGRR